MNLFFNTTHLTLMSVPFENNFVCSSHYDVVHKSLHADLEITDDDAHVICIAVDSNFNLF